MPLSVAASLVIQKSGLMKFDDRDLPRYTLDNAEGTLQEVL